MSDHAEISHIAASTAANFSQDYHPLDGRRDAMSYEGVIQPHWTPFIDAIQNLGIEELEQRQQEINRLLRENGVTYNVHGETGGISRPWQLDPIPLLIDNAYWQRLEEGLIQRALLFDLILSDIYGPGNLVREGLLPPEILYDSPEFCRPCSSSLQDGQPQLFLYAADLARDTEHGLVVLADRTEAPSGAGFAVENRLIMDRLFPDLVRDCYVRRLSTFFRALRTGLEEVAPHHKENPRIVLMTPGPGHDTYFEHAYLAAYLGYPLIQGEDVTVRKGRVWLKSLDGLKPVDVMYRRVDDRFCDPLELDEDSRIGVAGLLEAVRRGHVTIANPIGSSILENPGLAAFLPGITRHLLGEDLILPSVPTWWCGDPVALTYVLEHLDQLMIKPISAPELPKAIHVAELDSEAKDKWRECIRSRPREFVGQAAVRFSTAPALSGVSLVPRFTTLRCFLAAAGESYTVMPGGLTLSSSNEGALQVAARSSGISKDTWIIAEEPQMHISLWQQPDQIKHSLESASVLPSRAAENLFWVGRYAERAEGVTRLLRTILRAYQRINLTSEIPEAESVHILLRALTRLTDASAGVSEPGNGCCQVSPEEELLATVSAEDRSGSLLASLRYMLNAAYAVRHLWSVDSWRVINSFQAFADAFAQHDRMPMRRLKGRLDELITALMAFAGLNSESMTREQGWLLLDIGRRIERGMILAGFLKNTLAEIHETSVSHPLYEAVLATTENIITYRHRYRSFIHLEAILDQVVLDALNPRSLLYQLRRLQKQVARLPRDRVSNRLTDIEKLVLEAVAMVRLADIQRLTRIDSDAIYYQALYDLMESIENLLGRTSDELTRIYFSHAQRPRQLTSTRLVVGAR